jgi:hypothetical protein
MYRRKRSWKHNKAYLKTLGIKIPKAQNRREGTAMAEKEEEEEEEEVTIKYRTLKLRSSIRP